MGRGDPSPAVFQVEENGRDGQGRCPENSQDVGGSHDNNEESEDEEVKPTQVSDLRCARDGVGPFPPKTKNDVEGPDSGEESGGVDLNDLGVIPVGGCKREKESPENGDSPVPEQFDEKAIHSEKATDGTDRAKDVEREGFVLISQGEEKE